MIRAVVGILGVVTALVPEGTVDAFERVAIERRGESSRNPWLVSAIRGEGILVAVVSLIGGRAYAWTMTLTGVFGAVVALAPGPYRAVATRVVYDDPDAVAWRERFDVVVRLLGVLYVLLSVREWRKRRAAE